MNQTHSADVVEVDIDSPSPTCDGMITRRKSLGLAVLAADCLPVLLASDACVGAIHIGRKGMEKKIATTAISKMHALGAREIQAFIGPSVCGKCYEVPVDMYQEIVSSNPASATSESLHCLDIKAAVIAELHDVSVTTQDLQICTMEDSSFFSHRVSNREGQIEGRQVGVISL